MISQTVKFKKFKVKKLLMYIMLIVFAIIILLPFWIMIVSSIKTPEEIILPIFSWFPKQGIDLTSYKKIFDFSMAEYTGNVLIGFMNTLLYVVPSLIVCLLTSGLSAYAFAKIDFKGKHALFSFLLLTMVMPGTVVLIPQFYIYSAIGWVNTPLPLIVPMCFGSAGIVFFLRQYMFGIPNELLEAARVDGLGYVKTFFKIMLPVCVPAFIAQAVLHFISGYNDYLGPLLFLSNATPMRFTLQLVLMNLKSTRSTAIQGMMANSVVALLPLVLLYLVLQKFIIDGISVGAVKG